ncbi:DNA cytosine methyltransferase [Erythrobacter sp.]|uniref:DNA cytosine methyltransferase n=1 Tax=Erythrobacter sp. TaxID=1042 RepID=UPI001425C72B|nr:DNA (cytosine-5-)-methyltransferase [Erythrobacter sp.]QIQ88310.1 MAG: DNA cytosine methyltransferase [Erythrobacter sp.]
MIDLFAGCGGLSLGFEMAGYTPVFVNELNDDARETYLINRSHDLGGLPFNENKELHSADIGEVDSKTIAALRSNLNSISTGLGDAFGVDVLTGGPPCQGYSGIGHRRSYSVDRIELPSNQLYGRMAWFIEQIRPKLFLFENVKGLLSSRWRAGGQKGEIWDDVFKRFQRLGDEHGYYVKWSLVHASDYDVPQNRPRVLIAGISKEVANAAQGVVDLQSSSLDAVECGFLPPPSGNRAPNLNELLSDLEDPDALVALQSGEYPKPFETTAYPRDAAGVQEWFRPGDLAHAGAKVTDQEYSRHARQIVEKFLAMHETGGEIPKEYRTKKFAQRLLPPEWGNRTPWITATSMPDDYVHYSQPRILTVREWARLQTFPDWYQFAGKRTTGGLRRAGNPREGNFDREVPKYTQIGNAVAVKLAEHVGRHFDKILTASAS